MKILTPMQDHLVQLAFDPDYRVLERIKPRESYAIAGTRSVIKTALVVDTETTGLHNDAKLIEFGCVRFTFSPITGEVFDVTGGGSWLEDPGEPLTDEVKAVTGLTDEMLRGQHLDDDAIAALLSSADLVIAHNAAFDRPKIERRFQGAPIRFWACSSEQIDWKAENVRSRSLEFIAYRMGFFYDAHRAQADCAALVHLLAQRLPVSGRFALRALLDAAVKPSTRLIAINTPFETKDLLKRRGYRWEGGDSGRPKGWWIDTTDEAAEREWLSANIVGRFSVLANKLTGWNRFTDRAFTATL